LLTFVFFFLQMAEEYAQSVLCLVVAQICKSLGWDTINQSALEVLVDFARRHIKNIGRNAQRYADQCEYADKAL